MTTATRARADLRRGFAKSGQRSFGLYGLLGMQGIFIISYTDLDLGLQVDFWTMKAPSLIIPELISRF